MSQKPRKSKHRTKRKKCEVTSPNITQNKKSRPIADGDFDTDIEYLSAAEFTTDSAVHQQTPTMDKFVITSTSVPTSTSTSLSASTSSTSSPNPTFTLSAADRDNIAQLVCDKLKHEFAAMVLEITQPIRDELNETKVRLDKTVQENAQLKADLNDLRLAVDEQEQYSRRSCLRINGVIGDEGSPGENVENKLLSLATTHNIPIKPEDIDIAHRLGRPKLGFNRPVIVKFSNAKARQLVLSARKTLGNVYVNEDLTKFRQSLHYHARQLVRDKKLDRTWIGGGKVFACLPSSVAGVKFQIRSMTDIDKIRAGIPL